MLTTLIESRRRSRRSPGSTAASVVAHATLITLVAAVTAHASDHTPTTRPPIPDVIYVAVPEPLPAHRNTSSARTRTDAAPRLPLPPTRRIDVPPTIPIGLPTVDRPELVVDPAEFAISEHTRGDAFGTGTATPDGQGSTFMTWQVDKETTPLPGNPRPQYPSLLQSAHVDGEVLAQFVVDSTGLVDMSTFRALDATNELFASAVRRALARWKFQPAEAGGRKVRQLVQMPLTFRVR